MKRNICLLCIFFQCFYIFSNVNEIEQFYKDKLIIFHLIDNNNDYFMGYVKFEDNNITCGRGGGISTILFSDSVFVNDSVDIFFNQIIYRNYNEGDSFKYRRWLFPIKYKINITISDLKEGYTSTKSNKIKDILVDTSKTYPVTCQAIIIDNLNIRDKPSLAGKKTGLLKKGTEVTLYEESSNVDEIDGEKNFWYKVKTDDKNYGWVYGGYVRIFFEDESLGYSDKEKILESLK